MIEELRTDLLGRLFPCILSNSWTNPEHIVGRVTRDTWRDVKLRGFVPIYLRFKGREVPADLCDVGEHFLYIQRFSLGVSGLGLTEYWEEDAEFRIDWSRAVPERLGAQIASSPNLLDRWRDLTFDEVTDLIAPIRRARTPRSILQREAEALDRLGAGGSPKPRDR